MAANKITIYPCTYKDCSTESREFDREYGYYTEHYPCHKYKIKVETDINTEEYIFKFDHKIKHDDQTLEKLKELSSNDYIIKKYNNDCQDEALYENYYNGVLKLSESKIYHIGKGEWILHGPTTYPSISWMGHRLLNYKYGIQHGWEIIKEHHEQREYLYVDGQCIGHRIRVDGEITTSNIDSEKLALFE